MFEKIGQLAERVATDVSRRSFLGRAGQASLAVVGVMAGLFAVPPRAYGAGAACAGGYCPDDATACCSDGSGDFVCCPPATPHTCRGAKNCYETLEGAKKECEADAIVVCAAPAE